MFQTGTNVLLSVLFHPPRIPWYGITTLALGVRLRAVCRVMTPTKESAEVASAPAASDLSETKGRSRPESPHLRADAVSLEVAVKVHGSFLPSVSPGAVPGSMGQAQPFEEESSTMIVFPQGSVLKMSTAVVAGQVMVLTNQKSRQDAICRVVKVRAYGAGQSYVEIEFTSPQPGYWGVYFPSDGPEVARLPQQKPSAAPVAAIQDSPAPSTPPASQSAIPPQERRTSEMSQPMAASPVVKSPEPSLDPRDAQQSPVTFSRQSAASKLPESSFASIGTQEEVLAPADAPRERRVSLPMATGPDRAPSAGREMGDVIDALTVSAPKTVAPPRRESREIGPTAAVAAKPSESYAPQTDTRLPLPKQMFGVTLDSVTPSIEKPSRQSGNKPLWIGGGIAAVIVVAAGAGYYLRVRPSLNRTASVAPAAASVSAPSSGPSNAQPSVAQTAVQSPAAAQPVSDQSTIQSVKSQSQDASLATEKRDTPARPSADAVDSLRKARESENDRERIAARAEPSVAIPSAFGALNTRPVVASHESAASAGAAPALTVNESPTEPNGSLPAIAPPPPTAPAASKPVSNVPIRVGGKILPPRLISSVLPVYPEIAREASVTGTVVIDTTIDQRGNVAKMRVISGPELLRQAALSALRQWKYEPSKLNGQAISTEMIVSIQFH